MLKFLAFDYGASSGRAILGQFDGQTLGLSEVHRFINQPVFVRGSLYWDVLRLFHELKQGMLNCFQNGHGCISSLGIDTWGVDFGLLDCNGELMANPFHYRDKRTEGMLEEAFSRIPRKEIFMQTGIQFIWFNTLYQLLSMKIRNSPLLEKADCLLMMPDLLNYFLTGVKSTEYTNATTTQLFNPVTGAWAGDIIDRLGLPAGIFSRITKPGTVLGDISEDICSELGINRIPVVSVASHDTGSAVAAVPASERDYAYISCGTWSLMGAELDKPVINKMSLKYNFTNEGGVGNTIRFLKNIMGLWLIQESKRQWDREGEAAGYEELEKLSETAEPFRSFIDPDHIMFATPGDMPGRIREFCRQTEQPVPESKGEIIRCIIQSLALKYRYTLECLESILGRRLNIIHMVGGGIKNETLCRFTANATARKVAAGPVEATAIGNIALQAIALNEVRNLQEARTLIKESFPLTIYKPENTGEWDEAYKIYRKILNSFL
jgi:rhamnulokinase